MKSATTERSTVFQFFYQYQTCSGIREFASLGEAAEWADALLDRCPDATIIRES